MVKKVEVKELKDDVGSGFIEIERARVNWKLSINFDHIPERIKAEGKRTFRFLTMDREQIEFSDGFTELHTRSYEEILKGNGFGLQEARLSIELAHRIRDSKFRAS